MKETAAGRGEFAFLCHLFVFPPCFLPIQADRLSSAFLLPASKKAHKTKWVGITINYPHKSSRGTRNGHDSARPIISGNAFFSRARTASLEVGNKDKRWSLKKVETQYHSRLRSSTDPEAQRPRDGGPQEFRDPGNPETKSTVPSSLDLGSRDRFTVR